eukprot:1359076-Amphidinium_carterae.1
MVVWGSGKAQEAHRGAGGGSGKAQEAHRGAGVDKGEDETVEDEVEEKAKAQIVKVKLDNPGVLDVARR